MCRFLCLSMFVAIVVSCTPKDSSKEQDKSPLGTAVSAVKEGAAPDAAAVKEAAQTAAKETTEAAKAAVKAVEETASKIPEVSAIMDSGFSINDLKTSIGSFTPEALKDLASKLGEAVQSQDGVVKGIQDQITKLVDPSKLDALKKTLESSTGVLKGLKDKLQLVVTKLKESGIDVSKYTSLLGG